LGGPKNKPLLDDKKIVLYRVKAFQLDLFVKLKYE